MSPKASAAPGSPDWWASRSPGPTYQRGRPPVDGARIIEAALKLVDEVGVQALTLRMLAEALESGTATLYRHFPGKDEILAHVLDKIFGEVRVPAEVMTGLSWREAAAVAAQTFYEVLCRHPNAMPLLVAQVPVGPNSLLAREKAIALFLGYGFSVGLSARAFTALGHYSIGFAIQQHGPGTARPEDQIHLRDYYRSLDPALYPATAAAAEDLTCMPLREEFQFGLNLLLDGLELARQAESR